MTSALRFPAPDWSPPPSQNPRPTLALLMTLAGCWGFWLVGYCSGRTAERGSQLGQVLALAPQRDSVEAALAWARTLQARLAALRTPPAKPASATLAPNRPRMTPQKVAVPVGHPTQISIPAIPLPQIRP